MSTSIEAAIRAALTDWAKDLMADLTGLMAVPTPEGDTHDGLEDGPVLGVTWAKPERSGVRPTRVGRTDDGHIVWLIGIESVSFDFTWRCPSLDAAELVGQKFVARANVAATRVDPGGCPTTRLTIDFGGYETQAALYMTNSREMADNDRAQQRDEWIVKVGCVVSYPVVEVDDDAAGGMTIIVTVNGTPIETQEPTP